MNPNAAANLTKPFKPGQSGNPGGRPKGFAFRVRKRCGKDGEKLVEGFWMIAFGTQKQRREFFGEHIKVTAKERLTAMGELADRGFGRPATLDEATEARVPIIIFNLPRASKDLEGRTVVRNALDVSPSRHTGVHG